MSSTGWSFFTYAITFLKCLNNSSFQNLALIICICESALRFFFLTPSLEVRHRSSNSLHRNSSLRMCSIVFNNTYISTSSWRRHFLWAIFVPITQITKTSLSCDFLSFLHNWKCLDYFIDSSDYDCDRHRTSCEVSSRYALVFFYIHYINREFNLGCEEETFSSERLRSLLLRWHSSSIMSANTTPRLLSSLLFTCIPSMLLQYSRRT